MRPNNSNKNQGSTPMTETTTPKPKTTKIYGQNTEERRKEITSIINLFGKYNLDVPQLAKKWNVSERMIYTDIDACIRLIPAPQVQEEARKQFIAYERIASRAMRLVNDAEPKTAAEGMRIMLEYLDKFTKFLEAYGYKEKVAERLDIRQVTISQVYQRVEDLRREGKRILTFDDVAEQQ